MTSWNSRRLRDRAVIAQDGKCAYCRRTFTNKLPATADHVVPRHLGGKSTVSNIVASCEPCNRRKAGRRPTKAERLAAEQATRANAELAQARIEAATPDTQTLNQSEP